jgi:Zn-finger nucleic acid-binding protein
MEPGDMATRRALSCPVFGSLMATLRRGLVEVDRCDAHGVWLDRGELEQVLGTERRHGARGARWEADAARRQGRVQGSAFGWVSLLLD